MRMQNDIKNIKDSNKVYVPADKTSNIYKVDKQEYDRILTNSITKTYKKTDNNTKNLINKTGKAIQTIISETGWISTEKTTAS